MNAGAQAATGDLLLFLHADSYIKLASYQKKLGAMKNSEVIGGAAEHATIYNCLKCIWKVKAAQKVTVKVTAENSRISWTVLDEYAKEAVIFYIR